MESKAKGYFMGSHKMTNTAFNAKMQMNPNPQKAPKENHVGGIYCDKNAKSNPKAATQFAKNNKVIKIFLSVKEDFFFFLLNAI